MNPLVQRFQLNNSSSCRTSSLYLPNINDMNWNAWEASLDYQMIQAHCGGRVPSETPSYSQAAYSNGYAPLQFSQHTGSITPVSPHYFNTFEFCDGAAHNLAQSLVIFPVPVLIFGWIVVQIFNYTFLSNDFAIYISYGINDCHTQILSF